LSAGGSNPSSGWPATVSLAKPIPVRLTIPITTAADGGSVQQRLSAAGQSQRLANAAGAADKLYSLKSKMIEGPYKSNRSGWVSEGMAGIELIGLVFGFVAGCYFIGKAAFAFFIAGTFLKLAVLVACVVAFIGMILIASYVWRLVGVFAFATLGPLFQYVSG
jgi:hypothetical protein